MKVTSILAPFVLLLSQAVLAQPASVVPPPLAQDDPAAVFCRRLAERIRSLPRQVPVLRWEVELVRAELKEDGTPNKDETAPPEFQTVHIMPDPDSNRYKIEYHPMVSRWKGTDLGRWEFQEKIQRHDGEDVLTVFTRTGTENGMSPRTTASVDKFDPDELRWLHSSAALDMLLPFLRRHHSTTPLVKSLEAKNIPVKFTRLAHGTRLDFTMGWSDGRSYHDEFEFPDAHPGAVSRHAMYTLSKDGKVMEMEATADEFVELTKEWSVPQKIRRIVYAQGKPWIETTYKLKAQIDPEPEQWLDLAIPGRYNVEDNIRGTQFLTPR